MNSDRTYGGEMLSDDRPVYPRAVAALVGEIRESLVGHLAILIERHHRRSGDGVVLWEIVDDLQAQCRELCGLGLDYQTALRFSQFAGPDADRWIEDTLF